MATKDEASRRVLVASVAALLGIGATMIYSTTACGDGSLLAWTFLKQMGYLAFGIVCAAMLVRVDYRRLAEHKGAILAGAGLLLVLVLVPGIGHKVNGARRWLRIWKLQGQPSEFAKLALVVFLAGFLSERMERIRSFRGVFLPAVLVTGTICLLILVEPDIGTTILVGGVVVVMLFVAGCRIGHLAVPFCVAIPILGIIVSRGYAWARIEAWIDPWKHSKTTGYHIIQSLIAIGSGGLTGRGLGASQQKLSFLPEAQTDFIFAILAEEMGLVGVTGVLALYGIFIWCGITIARNAKDTLGELLATGVTTLVALQAITNIAVVTKVFPTKGIALPFISAGGSSAVALLCGVAILYSVSRSSSPDTPIRVQ